MQLLQPERYKKRMKHLRRTLRRAGIRHFKAEELVSHHNEAWPFGDDYPPPTGMHENIVPTLRVADKIRDAWGGPVQCLSAHRNSVYNDLLGAADNEHRGAEDSQHIYFRATDLRPVKGDIDDFIACAIEVIEQERKGTHYIGFGTYSTFTHIDTGRYAYHRNWGAKNPWA